MNSESVPRQTTSSKGPPAVSVRATPYFARARNTERETEVSTDWPGLMTTCVRNGVVAPHVRLKTTAVHFAFGDRMICRTVLLHGLQAAHNAKPTAAKRGSSRFAISESRTRVEPCTRPTVATSVPQPKPRRHQPLKTSTNPTTIRIRSTQCRCPSGHSRRYASLTRNMNVPPVNCARMRSPGVRWSLIAHTIAARHRFVDARQSPPSITRDQLSITIAYL